MSIKRHMFSPVPLVAVFNVVEVLPCGFCPAKYSQSRPLHCKLLPSGKPFHISFSGGTSTKGLQWAAKKEVPLVSMVTHKNPLGLSIYILKVLFRMCPIPFCSWSVQDEIDNSRQTIF